MPTLIKFSGNEDFRGIKFRSYIWIRVFICLLSLVLRCYSRLGKDSEATRLHCPNGNPSRRSRNFLSHLICYQRSVSLKYSGDCPKGRDSRRSMKLKPVAGDSAGVVTAYYMASKEYKSRDELDFEFLGNKSGQPYALQTNVFYNRTGDREMRHELWFDPTADYHTYSFLWNNHQIVFFVDLVPLRVYRRTQTTPRGDFRTATNGNNNQHLEHR